MCELNGIWVCVRFALCLCFKQRAFISNLARAKHRQHKTAERAAYVVAACVVAACVVVGVFLCSLFPCQRAKLSAAIQLMCLANEYGSEREHCHAGAARRYSVLVLRACDACKAIKSMLMSII